MIVIQIAQSIVEGFLAGSIALAIILGATWIGFHLDDFIDWAANHLSKNPFTDDV